MAGTTVLYEAKIAGTKTVVQGLQKIESEAVKAGKSASKAVGDKDKGLAGAISKASSGVTALSSNIGVFGDKASKEFSSAASNALGLAAIVGTGGTLGFALAGAAAGASLMAMAFTQAKTQVKQTEGFIKNLSRAASDWEKQRIAQLQREGRAVTELDAIQEQAHGESLRRNAESVERQIDRLEQTRAKQVDAAKKAADLEEAARGRVDRQQQQALLRNRERAEKALKDTNESLKLLTLQFNSDQAQSQAAFERAATIREKLAGDEREKNRKDRQTKRKADRDKELADEARRRQEFVNLARQQGEEMEALRLKRLTGFDSLAEFNAFANQVNKEMETAELRRLTGFETQAEFDAFVVGLKAEEEQAERTADALLKSGLAIARRKLEMQEAREEMARSIAVEQTMATATTALSASNMVLMSTYQALVPVQEKFLLLNRTTAQQEFEQLKNRKEVIASLAQLAQATLASIAIQAQGRSLQEGAEAVSATAAALVRFAFGDSAGGATLLAAAGQHVVAANMFAALGGGAAAGAVGIGAIRGQGGLIGLTQDERDQLNPLGRETAGATSTGGGAGGVSVGEAAGGGRDSGVTRVVINNFPGSVFTADENRAAKSITRAQRKARRDGFLQRQGAG